LKVETTQSEEQSLPLNPKEALAQWANTSAEWIRRLVRHVLKDIEEQYAEIGKFIQPLHDASLSTVRSHLEEQQKDQIGGPQSAGDQLGLLKGVVEIDDALTQQLNDGQLLDDSLPQKMSGFSSRLGQWASEVATSLEALGLQNSNRDENLKGKQKELVEITDLKELMDA
jgi:hypothetical protein